jgi:hypothetical protein
MSKIPPDKKRSLLPIPDRAAEAIARKYGYDQVVILARRLGDHPEPRGEAITTYGVDPDHSVVAAGMGNTIKRIALWPSNQDIAKLHALYDELVDDCYNHTKPWEREPQIEAFGRLLGR